MDLNEWKEHIAKFKRIRSIPMMKRTKEENEWLDNYYEWEDTWNASDRILSDWEHDRKKLLNQIDLLQEEINGEDT